MNFTQKIKHMNLISYKIGVTLDRYETKLNFLNFQYQHFSGSFREYRTWNMWAKRQNEIISLSLLPLVHFVQMEVKLFRGLSLKTFHVMWFEHRVIHNCSKTMTCYFDPRSTHTHSCLLSTASICVDRLGQNSMRCAGVPYLYIDYESRDDCARPSFCYNPKCKGTGSSDYKRNEVRACVRLACKRASEESGINDLFTVILL